MSEHQGWGGERLNFMKERFEFIRAHGLSRAQLQYPSSLIDSDGVLSLIAEVLKLRSASPPPEGVLAGLIGFLTDTAASNRALAANVVGGQRNRLFAEADDCDRWIAALQAATPADGPSRDVELDDNGYPKTPAETPSTLQKMQSAPAVPRDEVEP